MALQDASSVRSVESPDERIRSLRPGARHLPRPDLPIRQTSFVGRSAEIAEVCRLLAAPECRLLTIIGPGGIGKTRLALEIAEFLRETFPDGVAFVPLQPVSTGESIATMVAVAIGAALTGPGDAREQVARFLRHSQTLLVIDNFEHLIDEAPWLSELLAAVPGLRVLVTSREALNLVEEWRYPLAGLAVPSVDTGDPNQTEAVRLFIERASQVRRDFSLADEQEGVIRLCRITEGLPLALELAAAWTRTLSCAAIADELERNSAFLATDLRNVPARHRSMQAAFEYSWVLLTDDERRILRRLAVFRGRFRREAAEQIAGATLPLLASLVDKSLLRRENDGYFHLHELLRQYAAEHLNAAPDGEAARVVTAHRQFYLSLVADLYDAMTGGGQTAATVTIAAELNNVRAAWQNAVEAGDVALLARVIHPLALFYDFRARYREGLELLEEGLRALQAAEPTPLVERALAALFVDLARFHHRTSQLQAMRDAVAEAEARYARLDTPPPGQMTDPCVWRALIFLIDGDYPVAARLGREVVERNLADNLPGSLPLAWWIRAGAALWQGQLDEAEEYARAVSASANAVGDRWYLTYGHNMQGHVAVARGNYPEARRHFEASYAIREELGDPEGMGTSLGHLGRIAAFEGDWERATDLCQQALVIAREIGDLVTLTTSLNVLNLAACAAGDYPTAGRHLAEGLRLLAGSGFVRLLFILLTSSGEWLLRTGRTVDAVEPLALAWTHPGSDPETRNRARMLLDNAAAALSAEEYATAVERVQDIDPDMHAARLIPLLLTPPSAGPTGLEHRAATPPQPAAPSPLVEPLTARELDVLQLIAAGRSNREIADELFLAVNTIRSYSQQLYSKLGVSSRTQAIARARELGLLP